MNAIEEILPGNVDASYSDADPDAFLISIQITGTQLLYFFFYSFCCLCRKNIFPLPHPVFFICILRYCQENIKQEKDH